MNSHIYLKDEENFIEISDKDLATRILNDFKDLIDIFAGAPSRIYFHMKDGTLLGSPFSASTWEFNNLLELGLFLQEKSPSNYIAPYQVTHSENKIRLRVTLIPIEYNLIGLEGLKNRKIRISKIDRILEN